MTASGRIENVRDTDEYMRDFKDLIEAALVKLGGCRNGPESSYQYTLHTIAGPLLCSPEEDALRARFSRPEVARGVVQTGRLNANSGTWDLQFSAPGPEHARSIFLDLAGLLPILPFYGDIPGDARLQTAPVRTILNYMYRDHENNKMGSSVVFQPETPPRLFLAKALIRTGHLPDGISMLIPGQVGLKDLQASFLGCEHVWNPDIDHVFHEITGFGSSHAALPTDPRTFSQFVGECVDVALSAHGWDENYKPPFYEQMKANYDAFVSRIGAGQQSNTP